MTKKQQAVELGKEKPYLTYAEIAKQIGCSRETVSNALGRRSTRMGVTSKRELEKARRISEAHYYVAERQVSEDRFAIQSELNLPRNDAVKISKQLRYRKDLLAFRALCIKTGLAHGFTQVQIAEGLGITRQAVSLHWKKNGT